MNILVVAPKFVNRPGDYYAFPLGIAYISAALKRAGFSVYCLNLNHYENDEQVLADCILSNGIEIICTGGISEVFTRVETIIHCAQQTQPKITTIIGGGLLTSDPQSVFELFDSVDYGVLGEGEETIVDLIETLIIGKPVNAVKGIIYRDSAGSIIVTENRNSIDDLSKIAFPDFDGFEADKYLENQNSSDLYDLSIFDKPRCLPIISSRSCPFNCTFCFHPLGNKYRQRSIANFFEELDYLIEKYNINYACVYDELFSNDKERIIAFCEEMKKRNIKWLTQLRVDRVDEEMLTLLKESGLYLISYGIESADNRILASMKKHITIEQIEKALDITAKVQIGFTGNLIFGDPEETWETVTKTMQWYEHHREYQFGVIPIAVYPGTPIYWLALQKKQIKDKAAFLRQPKLINVSKLTDKQYANLLDLLWIRSVKACVETRAQMVRMERVPDETIQNRHLIETICPFCNHHNIYPRLKIVDINRFFGMILLCKHCYRKHVIYDSTFSARMILVLPTFIRRFLMGSARPHIAKILRMLRLSFRKLQSVFSR